MKDYKSRQRSPRLMPAGGPLLRILVGVALGLALTTGMAVYVFDHGGHEAKTSAGQVGRLQLDFYRILPGQETPVSEPVLEAGSKAADRAGARAERYFLQAGAFQNAADADNLKARLALAGLVASVEPASLPDRGTWYRVRLGPYAEAAEINRVRAALAQNGVDASLVRSKH